MRRPLALTILAIALNTPAGAQALDPCGSWAPLETPIPDNAGHSIVRDVVAIAPDDVWAVGGWSGYVNDTFQTLGFAMHWDGEAWSLIPTPQPAPCNTCINVTLWGVDAVSSNDVWACGNKLAQAPDGFTGTHMLVMHWDGASWQEMETPIQSGASGDILWKVEAIASDDVWFFGENIYAPFPLMLDLAIALHWDGSNFEFTEVPIVNFQSSGFADGNSLHDGDAIAPDDMWAVGAGGDGDSISCNLSQIHHWDGSQWTHVPADAPDGCFYHDLNAVEMIATDDVWAGGETFDGDYHGLALHWDGSSWTEVPIQIGVSDFVAFASDDVYAFGGAVAHWDGAAWTIVEDFAETDSVTIAGADEAGPCEIFIGGRQIIKTEIQNFTAQLIPDQPTKRSADFNTDGVVDGADLGMLLAAWGTTDSAFDLNADGVIDGADLGLLLGDWGV